MAPCRGHEQFAPARRHRLGLLQRRKASNVAHESNADTETMLFRGSSGREALLYHSLHGLKKNLNPLLSEIEVTEANGKSERPAHSLPRPSQSEKQDFLSVIESETGIGDTPACFFSGLPDAAGRR